MEDVEKHQTVGPARRRRPRGIVRGGSGRSEFESRRLRADRIVAAAGAAAGGAAGAAAGESRKFRVDGRFSPTHPPRPSHDPLGVINRYVGLADVGGICGRQVASP